MVLAAVLAAGAHASARPVTAADRALLERPATADEKIAEGVAERLTGHKSISVRCLRMHLYLPNVFGVTPMLNGRAFDYFLMEPEACTYVAWFRESPARWDPRTCQPSDCKYVVPITFAPELAACGRHIRQV